MKRDIEIYVSEEEIKNRVQQLGEQISKDYGDQEVTIIAVLTGSFIFCADLLRHITCPVKIEFIMASSKDGRKSTGTVDIKLDLKRDISDHHVILIEDVVDTGLTVTHLLDMVKKKNPKSLKLCAFLYKPAQMKHKVDVDYLGFEVEDKFLVGYGLDYNGLYRELPYIGVYDEK